MIMKWFTKTPYVYDMDSSLSLQIVDKLSFLKPLHRFFDFFEKKAIQSSIGVVAVCKALEELAQKHAPEKLTVCLEDISLLDTGVESDEDLRDKYHLQGPIMLYVGNLESYQGIELLLHSFEQALYENNLGNLVIIGGSEKHIETYTKLAEDLGIHQRTWFCGPRPINLLGHFLKQADILVSPRIQGNNTPMKIYSYLDSGKPVLATRLATHTQVLTDDFSVLVEPDKKSMAAGMLLLLKDVNKRREIGQKGQEIAQENYSLHSFRKKLQSFYTNIWTSLKNYT